MAETIDFQYIVEHGDPRVGEWFLMASIWNLIPVVGLYVLFATIVGPAWMKGREPFDLRLLITAHSCVMTLVCGWFFYQFGIYGWFYKYRIFCEPTDYSNNPDALWMAKLCWMFLLTKLVELLDTIFFILRKKNSQVNFIHVSHHFLAPLVMWMGTKYAAGGYNTIFCFVNSFVHTTIYIYYSMSSLSPGVNKFPFLKRLLTLLQLMQFAVLFGYIFYLNLFNPGECKIPPIIFNLYMCNSIGFFLLFLRFYFKTFRNRSQSLKNSHSRNEEENIKSRHE